MVDDDEGLAGGNIQLCFLRLVDDILRIEFTWHKHWVKTRTAKSHFTFPVIAVLEDR